jgi:uncharacterized protein YjiS (DUF1127 family)
MRELTHKLRLNGTKASRKPKEMTMSRYTETGTQFSQPAFATHRPQRRNGLLVWIDAYREHSALQKLDADALSDMGLTEASRASVTVSEIAARMRG